MNADNVNKFRILMLSEKFPPAYSGAGMQVQHLSSQLSLMGHDVTVLSHWRAGSAKREIVNSFQVRRLWTFGNTQVRSYFFGMSAALWLCRRLRSFDVLHVHLDCTSISYFLSVATGPEIPRLRRTVHPRTTRSRLRAPSRRTRSRNRCRARYNTRLKWLSSTPSWRQRDFRGPGRF